MCFISTRSTYLNVKLVKSHDGPKIEERQVEVVLEKLQDVVVSIFSAAVLQGEAGAAHDGEAAASVEKNVTQLEVSLHEPRLRAEDMSETSFTLSQRAAERVFLPARTRRVRI